VFTRSRLGIYLLLAAMPLFFVSNVIIGRATANSIEPWTLAFWRWVLASLILLPFAARAMVENRVRLRAAAGDIFVLGFLGMAVCGGVFYLSLHWTTAIHGVLIYTVAPLLIVLLDAVFFGERITVPRGVGMLVGFLGVTTIVLEGEPQRLLTLAFNPGDILMAICATAWAVYSVWLRRARMRAIPTLPALTAICIAGTLTLAPGMAFEAFAGFFPTGLTAWAAIVVLAILPSVLAYGIFQLGVQALGASVVSGFMYLLPVYGVVVANITLGESFRAYHAVGLVLVLAGVVLATNPFVRKPT
jgi:drug/metabolite transporter (DMT)-like permease